MLELNKIYFGDSSDILKQVSDNSTDLVVTSPPYDNLRTYNDTCDWNFDKFKEIAMELKRVLKDGGVIVWVVSDATVEGSETCSSFKQAIYFTEIGLNLHDTMIWFKPNCFNFGSNLCYKQSFEYMFVFSKGKPKTVNFIKDIKALNGGKTLKGGHKNADGTRDNVGQFKCEEFKKRYNVWDINVSSETNGHPAVFPIELARDHIISWSNEGDLVLDPFVGSGTTCKAAHELKRNYIGIEKVQEYYDIAVKRLRSEQIKRTLI